MPADLSALINAGQATASIHAFADGSFFYYDHYSDQDFSDSTVASNFAFGTQWLRQHNIPISTFVVPHYYEFGTNVFTRTERLGCGVRGHGAAAGRPLLGIGLGRQWSLPPLRVGPQQLVRASVLRGLHHTFRATRNSTARSSTA